MKTRPVIAKPGGCGWTRNTHLHSLPPDLPDRSPVFIVAVSHGVVRVRDANNKEWELERPQVDCGILCVTPAGGWLRESTPKVQSHVRELLRKHVASPRPEGGAGRNWDEKASRLLWILQRNRSTTQLIQGEDSQESHEPMQERERMAAAE